MEPDRRHAVENGELLYTSVSALNKFRSCPRAYYFRYVQRLPDKPPSKGQQRGLEGHKRIEHYLKTGQDVLSSLERKGVEKGYIPSPGSDLLVEYHVDNELTAQGVPFIGSVDLINPRDYPETVRVFDWKFKKDISKWGASAEELVDPVSEAGVQMLGYGEFVRLRFPGVKTLEFAHVTFQTEGRQEVSKVGAKISLTEVSERWQKATESIGEMKRVVREGDAFKVFGNEKACDKYGGCAYRDKCFDPMQRVLQGFRQNRNAERTVNAVENKGDEMGLLKDMVNGAKKNALVQPHVLPPDAPKPGPALAPTPEIVSQLQQAGLPVPASVPAAAQGPTIAASGAAQAEAPKKRGRPRKNPEAVSVPPTTVGGTTDKSPLLSVFLYMNAVPNGIATKTLAAYVEERQAELMKAGQIDLLDIRTANDNVFGFNRWEAYLSDTVRKTPPPPGHYVVLRGDRRLEVAADALASILPPGHFIIAVR